MRALNVGLVDALGGVHRAVAVAKQFAEIPDDEQVTVFEIGRERASPLALLGEQSSPLMFSIHIFSSFPHNFFVHFPLRMSFSTSVGAFSI